jgi:hypothetical protein
MKKLFINNEMSHFKTIYLMNSNEEKKLHETKRVQSFISSSSDTVGIPRKSIDPSKEISEQHLLLEENSVPRSSTIPKDDDPKHIDKTIDTFKKEKQQPQMSSFPLFSQKSVYDVTAIKTKPLLNEITNSILAEQHARRTVTFDDNKTPSQSISNRSIPTSHVNPRLSNHDLTSNDQPEKESVNTSHLSDTVIDSGQMSFTIQDLNNLVSNKDFMCVFSHICQPKKQI